jgi:mannitol/fructose-specific phosphotransferase system IIA component (Ntr-type)
MDLRELVDPALVFTDVDGASADAVLAIVAERLEREGAIPSAEELRAKLLERERQGSTAIGGGVAIPHCKLASLERLVMAVATTPAGIDAGAPDQQPVRVFFLLVSPERSPGVHLQSLAAISRWLKDDGNLERIRGARSSAEAAACLRGERQGTREGAQVA